MKRIASLTKWLYRERRGHHYRRKRVKDMNTGGRTRTDNQCSLGSKGQQRKRRGREGREEQDSGRCAIANEGGKKKKRARVAPERSRTKNTTRESQERMAKLTRKVRPLDCFSLFRLDTQQVVTYSIHSWI